MDYSYRNWRNDPVITSDKEVTDMSKRTSKYAGTEVKCDGVEYNIVRQSDILAVVVD